MVSSFCCHVLRYLLEALSPACGSSAPPLRFTVVKTDFFSLMIGPGNSNFSLDRNTSLFTSDFLDQSCFTAFKGVCTLAVVVYFGVSKLTFLFKLHHVLYFHRV